MQADEILWKINALKISRVQTGTHLLPRMSCDVAYSSSNRSPSFEVSAIFLLRESEDNALSTMSRN